MSEEVIRSIEPSEKRDRLNKIIDYAKSEILPYEKRPDKTLMYEGYWYPSHMDEIDQFVPFFSDIIDTVADRANKSSSDGPVFLDLGSGDGLEVMIAAAGGKYAKCYGVETRLRMNTAANEYKQKLAEQGVINLDSVRLVSGSYYDSEYWPDIRNRWYEEHKLRIESESNMDRWGMGLILGIDTPVDTPTSTEQIKEQINSMEQSTNVMRESGLLIDGKLQADVIYWYPSDPFAVHGMSQWNSIMKSGTILVVARNRQIETMEQQGKLDGFTLDSIVRDEGMKIGIRELHVYRKD